MTSAIHSVCVYCGSSNAVDDHFKEIARRTGALFGAQGWRLVYGGGSGGLMGVVADSALAGGAEAVGVIPDFLVRREVAHTGLTTLHVTDTLHQRQTKMAELSDAFIVLPGGLGTLAEFFEILTWKQLGQHGKPVVLVNHHGYWDPLLAQIEAAAANIFLYASGTPLFRSALTPEEIPSIFRPS